jgi:hypothetical protein
VKKEEAVKREVGAIELKQREAVIEQRRVKKIED